MTDKPTYEELVQQVHDLEVKLEKNKNRFNAIQHCLQEFIYEHDLNGIVTDINLERITQIGYTRKELVGTNVKNFIVKSYQGYFDDYMERVISNGSDEGLMNVMSKDGESHIFEYMNTLVREEGVPAGVLGVARDITEQLRNEQDLVDTNMRFSSILRSIEDGYYEVDLAGNMTFFNNRVNEHLGYTQEEMQGINYRDYMDEKNAKIVFETFHNVFVSGKSVKSVEWELMKKDRTKIFVDASVNLMTKRNNEPCGFHGIIRDATDRKRSEQELAFLAYHDALTGLYNRKAFIARLEETLKDARRYEKRRAILFMDLDKFKMVNDIYGHEIGDKILIEVSKRLRTILRDTDYISRLGGDEFTVILGNSTELLPGKVAQRIIDNLCRPYDISGIVIDFVTPSLGIGVYPDDGHDGETLLKHADQAMYKAKETGNRYVLYSDVHCLPPTSLARQGA
ncbi:MAG TPA: sensor domain-containing diguanylate cyclase [Deltaproteobacteria bacterium]|nr:sensor domain-containing diguanylate cyclase [Deltaproteobacteria bacterium]